MMWKFIVLCLIVSVMNSDAVHRTRSRYRGRRSNAVAAYSGTNAVASTGSSTGGYTGGSSYDYDDYDTAFGGGFPGGYGFGFGASFIDPYLFHQQLTSQILAQTQATQHAITALMTTGPAYASADASNLPDDIRIQNQIAAQQAYFENIRRQNHFNPSAVATSSRYAPSYAVAAGSIGPTGFHQTAYVKPANPAQPNIVNRFSASSTPAGGGGFQGIAVSSFSSTNPDGTGTRAAQTTINDNGKITTYSVHS